MSTEEEDWFGPEAATFGDRVAGAREAAGMTQVQLARRLGVKKATVASWEQDLSEPRANKLSMMAGLLNVSIMWLLTGEGEGGADLLDENDPYERDLNGIVVELRQLRMEMQANVERAAKLEKRLRTILKGDQK
ncbi:MAG: helix-turn-helix domain-containing protein [Rhodobacteraceae bacterium]|jgi:transcriptional regulator with XRE-family HTH domain|nr:helix-turn-helix domain-containing protein [Paracoccaceae bacterium]